MGLDARRGTAAGIALLAVLVGGVAHAGGGKPAPPPKPGADPRTGKPLPAALPPGCERVVDGRETFFSPDGRRLAFARWVADGSLLDSHGDPVPVAQPWVRDLATKKETKFPHRASPIGWTTAGALLLDDRYALDPVGGARVLAVPMPPPDDGLRAMAWTPDGKRVAYVLSLWSDPDAMGRRARTAEILEAGGKPRALDLGGSIDGDHPSFLSWSPDGTHLFYSAVFLGEGRLPVRRSGVWNLSSARAEPVGELPTDCELPCFHQEHSPMHREWKPPPGPRHGTAVWDALGNRLVFVLGSGHGEADLHVANADGGEVVRVTDDGEPKWSPSLDPAGRRAAVLVGARGARPRAKTARLRVVDLATGESKDYPLAQAVGLVNAVSWTRDGGKVLYEMDGGGSGPAGTYAQAVPAPPPAPDGGAIRKVDDAPSARVLRALASESPGRVQWAVAHAEPVYAEEMLADFRRALRRWVPDPDPQPATDLIAFLEARGAKQALPEVREALGAKSPTLAARAIAAVVAWDDRQAVPDLDRLRTTSPERRVRAAAAGAMVVLGDARGWDDLPGHLRDKESAVRAEAVRALGRIRQAKSVDLLIPLVEDRAALYERDGVDHTVADEVEWQLARLTGRILEQDRAGWTAWWTEEAKGSLPSVGPENEATVELRRRRDERAAKYAEEMRRRYGGDD